MDIMNFLGGLNGEFIKNKLLNAGIPAEKLQWVNFTDINQLNKLAG